MHFKFTQWIRRLSLPEAKYGKFPLWPSRIFVGILIPVCVDSLLNSFSEVITESGFLNYRLVYFINVIDAKLMMDCFTLTIT
jgi:hypothetical protein